MVRVSRRVGWVADSGNAARGTPAGKAGVLLAVTAAQTRYGTSGRYSPGRRAQPPPKRREGPPPATKSARGGPRGPSGGSRRDSTRGRGTTTPEGRRRPGKRAQAPSASAAAERRRAAPSEAPGGGDRERKDYPERVGETPRRPTLEPSPGPPAKTPAELNPPFRPSRVHPFALLTVSRPYELSLQSPFQLSLTVLVDYRSRGGI